MNEILWTPEEANQEIERPNEVIKSKDKIIAELVSNIVYLEFFIKNSESLFLMRN